MDSSNMTTSNLYAQKIITDQLEYRSGVVNLQLINSSNIYASNIIVDKITASAIEYPKGDVEFLGIVTSNVNTNNFTTSNMVVNHSFYINPNAVGNVVTEGLRATLYERLHKVFLISVETTFLTWTSEGVHFVDESDVEIFVNGMKLTYYNNNKYHFKISDIHYLNDFSQTKFDILLTDPVYSGDVVDIHIAPKLVGLSGNVYDYFAITSNVLNVKTVNEFYSPNATFSNIRILGSTIVGNNYSQKHPYQVESIHQAFINQSRTNNINIVKSGYFEASPNDVHMYINGTKLAYLTSNNTDYILTSNFSFQNQETTFTLTLDSDIIAGDIIDITLFPKAPRDQFGYFYQNFEIKTSWEDDKISLITLSNVGIGTHQPLSQFHVFGNSRFDGLLQASSIQGQLYGPWNLQSNISTSLLTIHQEHSQCNIAQFLANSKEIVTITQKGIGIGTTITQSSLHIGSNSTLLIGQHPLVSSYTAPLTIVSSNALFTNWSIDSTKSSIYEWKIGALATPSVYWTTEVTPQSEFILWNKTIQSKPFIVNHQGLVTLSNVSIIDTASISNLQTNQIITSNIWLTTSTITNTPIIQIIQPNENVTPILHASMGSNMFIVNSKGWIGIGTSPSVSIDINSTSAIQLPKGSNASRPSSNTGLIRFNIETSEFEGCYGNAWGTLGGVKSMDGSTRIETSQHLAFYTNNSERVTLMSNGNLGIGTSQPLTQLHLQGNALISGDLQVKGNLTFSNVNVLSEDVFINQDRPSIRNRLQIQPLLHKFIVPTNQYILHTETLEGLWQITPIGIDLYVNGTKWIYIDESNNDFTVTYAHIQNSNTQVNLVLATPLNSGDIMDITIWPKYISDASILQPGYILQNIYTYWNKDANCNIYYTSGNIGIGTILPKASLDVNGTLYSSNMNSITATVSNMNIPTQLTIGTHRIEKDTFTIQRTVSTPNPYLSISQLSESILYLDANGNLGIGTGLPTQKLHINGIGSSILIEDTLPTLQLKHTSLNTIWKLQLNASQNRLDIIDNSIPRLSFLGNGNIGIGTTLPNEKIHIEGGCFVSKSIRTPTFVTSNINVDDFIVISSNAFIGGKLQINNQLPQTALKITQLNSNAPLSSFYTSSSYPALHITSNGWIGIGTEIPYSSFHISTKDSLLLPVGSTEDRPIKASVGHIRYNTTLQQFEGYGSNEVWGSLGGIRSSDRKTYISAESYPGTNDCNLRFYTNDILQATLNPFGNVGIGTTNITHKLRVEGDAYVSGTITTPYMNITNAIFYNEDSPALRNRLQLAPTQLIQIINQDNLNQFQIIINGVWMIHSQKVHIHVNGYKLVYLDASNRDYTIDFQHINQNTQVTITLDNSLYIGDVLDISIWPSYYNENALNQSGIVIQNFNYSIWSSNMANANITYNNGNVGIGTTIATHKMSINGNTLIRGELSLYRNRYHTGGIFGTEFFPINGGTIIYDLNVYDNAIIELSSINLTLTIDFSNILSNIGKTVTIIIIERSNSNRNIVIDSFVKFANSRPFIIKALSTSKLTITVIKSNLILGEYDTDIASF